MWERHECPACSRSGYLHFALENQEDYEEILDHDRQGNVENVYIVVSVEWIPLAFGCPVCGLDLTEDEVVFLDGVESFIEDDKATLEDDALRSYLGYDDYEPDIDDWR